MRFRNKLQSRVSCGVARCGAVLCVAVLSDGKCAACDAVAVLKVLRNSVATNFETAPDTNGHRTADQWIKRLLLIFGLLAI